MPSEPRIDVSTSNPPRVRPSEIESLQAARGIAALLVVICHSAAFLGEEPGLWQRTPIYLWLRGTALGVQLFFVISGVVIFRAHREDFDQPQKAGSFYWKRFRRIYPLYWICLSPTLWKHYAVTDLYAPYQHLPSVIASSYLLIHLFSYQKIMVQAWTLFDEIQFYLVFSLCILSRRVGFAILSAWLAASFLFLVPASPYWLVTFSPYHLLFGLGILVALALEREKRIPARPIFWLGIVVFAGALVVAGPFNRGVIVRLVAGVGAACILLGAALLERRGRVAIPHWLVLLGDASYSIYLIHFMVISAIARFAFAHWNRLPVPIGVWMLLFILLGVGFGIAAYYAVERPLLRAMGKKSLGRSPVAGTAHSTADLSIS
jgi:exopolysaccharide production protein ExoZ